MANESSPAPETAPAAAPKVVRIHRFQIALNVLIQILVLFGIVLMANYLSFRHYKRWDYSRDQKFKLSSQTTNLLAHLKKPVRGVVFFSSAAEIAPDLQALMREYEFASKNKFSVEYVDPYRNLTRAQELQTKYKFGKDENILILDFDGRSKFVNATDMADFEMPDQMAMMTGQGRPIMTAFKGEQAITSALLEITEGKPNKIYYTTDHGEPAPADPDLKLLGEALKRQNIQSASLTLRNVPAIPEDARALIINGPKYDFSEVEMKLLSAFWEKKGRVFILLNPFAETPRLSAWLSEQGVIPQQDRVVGLAQGLMRDEKTGELKLVKGLVKDAGFVVVDSHTKITKDFEGLAKRLIGTTESLAVDKASEAAGKLKIVPLIESTEGFWGETDLTADDDQAFFDRTKDRAGPLPLAFAVEKGGVSDDRVKVETSRLVVVGNAQMLGGEAYRHSDTVTLGLSVNALNWLLDREDVIGIPPKAKNNTVFQLEDAQITKFSIAVMAIIPGIVALLGLVMWLLRRN